MLNSENSDVLPERQVGSSNAQCDDDVDGALIERFRSGDESAFDTLIELHQERVGRLVHRLCGWPADTEDLVQDVFLRVLQKLETFRGDARFSTWLTRIAVNRCRSYQRWQRLRARHLVRLWRRSGGAVSRQRPADEDERVRDAVRQLRATYRHPVVLRYFEGMSIREIGQVLNLSAGAVEVRLHRARQRLKRLLSDEREE